MPMLCHNYKDISGYAEQFLQESSRRKEIVLQLSEQMKLPWMAWAAEGDITSITKLGEGQYFKPDGTKVDLSWLNNRDDRTRMLVAEWESAKGLDVYKHEVCFTAFLPDGSIRRLKKYF